MPNGVDDRAFEAMTEATDSVSLFDAYFMEKPIDKETLKADISALDKKYDIYEDEGIDVVNELIDRELIYPSKMRELYFSKFQGN